MKRILGFLAALLAYAGLAFGAVNINSATQEQLETLNGVGPVKAKAIIDYRNKNGRFKTLEDIKKVDGIGDATFDKIRGDIQLTGTTVVPKESAKPADKPVTAKEAAATTKEKAKEATATTKEKAKEATATTKEKAKEATATTKEKAKDVAAETKSDPKQTAKEKADAKKVADKEKADAKKVAAKEKADARKQEEEEKKDAKKK